jgi:phosphoglycerol transferase MdoB-like AlkP superfamily enzyme
MLSGLYPRIAPSIVKLGDFRAHGLANILAPRGYEATFIDSWRLSWSPGDEQRRLLKNLGFGNLVELTPVENHWADDEADAFEHARERLLEAQHQGKRALIFMDTMVGHYPWRQDERLSARENMYTILEDFDALFGSFLAFLEEQGLEEHVLLMITGDHGLRFREEYVSLREERSLGLAFNVPFMLYAPGLLESSVRVPYASSHVDITPTLLDLVGSGDDEMVHHGESILERRIAHRITFFWNTSLSPVDGFHWKRLFFSYNNLTGRAQVARRADQGDAVSLRNALDAHSEIPVVLHDPKGLLQAATHLLDQTAAYQLRIEK